ncbi:MAG: zf-HC2 domain-containing protein [Tissierellia bacterium]|nr:zf-HC2 domain-containing protein [Tissierellia bacterium]
MENKCKIIEDLLPLYVEDMLTTESRKFVEENIKDCPECKSELQNLKSNVDIEESLETKPLEFLDEEIKKDKKLNNWAIGLSLLSLFIVLISFLTSPLYLPYSKDLIELKSDSEKHVINFSEKVTGYKTQTMDENEVWIEAWRTPLDTIIPPRGPLYLEIERPAKLLYSQNNGKVAIALREGRNGVEFKGLSLPRLAQNYYLMFAMITGVILSLVVFILKPKIFTKYMILGLPLSYILAHIGIFLPRGSMLTYDLFRDFKFMIVLSAVIYLLILTFGKIKIRKH